MSDKSYFVSLSFTSGEQSGYTALVVKAPFDLETRRDLDNLKPLALDALVSFREKRKEEVVEVDDIEVLFAQNLPGEGSSEPVKIENSPRLYQIGFEITIGEENGMSSTVFELSRPPQTFDDVLSLADKIHGWLKKEQGLSADRILITSWAPVDLTDERRDDYGPMRYMYRVLFAFASTADDGTSSMYFRLPVEVMDNQQLADAQSWIAQRLPSNPAVPFIPPFVGILGWIRLTGEDALVGEEQTIEAVH